MSYGKKFGNTATKAPFKGKPQGEARQPSLKLGFLHFLEQLINVPFRVRNTQVTRENGKTATVGFLAIIGILRNLDPNIKFEELNSPEAITSVLSLLFDASDPREVSALNYQAKTFSTFTQKQKDSIYKQDNELFVDYLHDLGVL